MSIPDQKSIALVKQIISQKQVQTVFQPIVKVSSQEIVGYEALTRITIAVEPTSVEDLFAIAAQVGVCLDLDRMCRDTALASAKKLKRGRLLFLNTDPDILNTKQLHKHELFSYTDFDPHDVVLEFTERAAVKKFTMFRKAIKYFKSLGFKISVDDVGTGFATVQRIVELNPDYIKISMEIIRNIDTDVNKQKELLSIVELAHKIKSMVIAEGVETHAELNVLRQVGVDIAQGFLFAKPTKTMKEKIAIKVK